MRFFLTGLRPALAGLGVLIGALSWATAAQALGALPDPKTLPARVELHALPSLTLSDADFLTGQAAAGQAVTVGAELRLANVPGRQPAVVLVHGSSGMGANGEMWMRDLNAMGVATLAIDGFTGRGITTTGANQAQLGRLNLALDAYKALDVLARHPRIDPQRVVLMGFSRGGQATLFASLKRFHETWNRSGIRYLGYIPFYPDCMTQYQGDLQLDAPVRIQHGLADDYNPAAPCKAYVDRLQKAGQDVQISLYEGAHHGFDSPLAPQPAVPAKGSQTVRACSIREEAPGRLVNQATGQVFSYQDACVQRDPQVGHDPAATERARVAVTQTLQTWFKLPAP
ncbi:MAG: carboxymethylenebutenolidase [Curvibacter sp.]|nr:MAG: carboxymethylenebutenolidase [Curvibacter sp.]